MRWKENRVRFPRYAHAVRLTLRISRRDRRFRPVRWHGEWLVRYPSATLPLSMPSPDQLDAETFDYFCWRYRPKHGDVVVDVGAGRGTEMLTFSRLVGPSGRVIAIEAHPQTFASAVRIRDLNGLKNVEVVQAAVMDAAGEVDISADRSCDLNSVIHASGRTHRVAAMTLDEIVHQFDLDRIDLLKMNIEGAERAAVAAGSVALGLTRNAAISCHDFVADFEGGSDEMRTRDEVMAALFQAGFDVTEREDPRPFVRSYLFAARP